MVSKQVVTFICEDVEFLIKINDGSNVSDVEELVNIYFNIISYINEKYIVETSNNGTVLIFVKNRVNRLAIEVVLENICLLQIVIVEVIDQNLFAVS